MAGVGAWLQAQRIPACPPHLPSSWRLSAPREGTPHPPEASSTFVSTSNSAVMWVTSLDGDFRPRRLFLEESHLRVTKVRWQFSGQGRGHCGKGGRGRGAGVPPCLRVQAQMGTQAGEGQGLRMGPGGRNPVPTPSRPSQRCPWGPWSVSLSEAVHPQLGVTWPRLGLPSARLCQVSANRAGVLSFGPALWLSPWRSPAWNALLGHPHSRKGSFHLDMSWQKALLWGELAEPRGEVERGAVGMVFCWHAGFHPQGHHRGLRGNRGAPRAPLPTTWAGTGTAHSPSSSCLGASLAGSRLRGWRRHLASRILKRAFCLMRAVGAPGESPHPVVASPWTGGWRGPGTAEREGLRVKGPAGGAVSPGSWGWGPLRADVSP